MSRTEQSESRSLWDFYIDRTFPIVQNFEFLSIPKQSTHFAVYICQDSHPNTEYVLRNVMHFLGPKWGLQIFAGLNLTNFIDDIVRGWRDVLVVSVEEDISDRKIMTRKYFWKEVKGEYQLLFDIDSLLCHGELDEFLGYDYIGAPWSPAKAVSPKCEMGSGGLSLRRKDVMMEICETCNPRPISREEVFFSVNLHLNTDKYRLPSVETAKRFAVESVYHPKPFGLHKSWDCLSVKQLDPLLRNINYMT